MENPKPAKVAHPVKILAREVKARNWSIADLATHSGLPIEIFHQRPFFVTQETANGLSRAMGTSPEFWLNLQASYSEWKRSNSMQEGAS